MFPILQDKYTRQLVGAMEDIFLEQYHVHPSLVADVHQFIYKSSGRQELCVRNDVSYNFIVFRPEFYYKLIYC